MGFPDAEFIHVSRRTQREAGDRTRPALCSRCLADRRLLRMAQPGEFLRRQRAVVAVQRPLRRPRGRRPGRPRWPIDLEHRRRSLLYEAGRPVLFIPYAAPTDSTFRMILVAWNGIARGRARRVRRAALHHGRRRDRDPGRRPPRTRPLRSGRRPAPRSPPPRPARRPTSPSPASASAGLVDRNVIENRCRRDRPDLMVMGAYSHSWLREFLFGGVTRTLCNRCPSPTFLSR